MTKPYAWLTGLITAALALALALTGAPAPLAVSTSAPSVAVAEVAPPTPEPTEPPVVNPVDNMAMVSGTIRRVTSTQWVALTDAGHVPTGIKSVTLLPDRVRVYHTFTATKVSSFQATPDESFAAASVRVGASVGFSYTDVFFYMGTSQTPVNPGALSKSGANVWLTGFFHIE